MKIYFTASLRGKKEFGDYYIQIVKCLEQLGNKVFSDHVLSIDSVEVEAQEEADLQRAYGRLLKEIKQADIFVAEVSTQSLSVGHEITEAMNLNKPVVLLHVAGKRPTMLFGSGYEKLQVVEYAANNLNSLVGESVEEAKKYADVRFNFFVSPRILSYLDWVAKTRMIPRSVFLRDLIEREMKKDKEFRE